MEGANVVFGLIYGKLLKEETKGAILMNITLTPELEQIVTRKMQSGQYDSPSAVIDQGLRLLEQEETRQELHFQELKREIRIGIEQADNGQVKSFDPDGLISRVRQQLAEG